MQNFKSQPFGTRLKALLRDRGMTQSDLARRMFPGEERVDNRGYTSPMGKDVISKWCNNLAVPNAVHLKKLSEVLKVPLEELAPDVLARDERNEPKEFEMSMVAGRSEVVRLSVNTLVPPDVALKIITLLTTSNDKDR